MIGQQKTYNILRASERYLKTDMVYLAKGGFWLILSQGISTITGLLLVIAFANLISAEIYGNYRYLLSIIGILTIGTFAGINTAAIKAVAEGGETTFWRLLKKKSYWSLTATILSLLVAGYHYSNGNTILTYSFIIAAIGIPLAYISGMYEALLHGRKNFKWLAILGIIVRVTTATAIISALFLTDNLFIIILMYFIPEIILQTLFLFYFYRTRSTTTDDLARGKQLTKFGFHLSFMEILKNIASQIDKLLVFHYLGASQLALYAIATTPPSQIKTLMQNLTTLALPKMSTASAKNTAQTLPQKLFRLEIIIVTIIISYWLVAPFIFPLIFPQYLEAVIFSQVYALSLIFFPRTFLSTAMTAHLKQKELYAIRTLAPAVRIGVFLITLPLWGLWGAVLGSLISNSLTAIIYQYYFKQAFNYKD